MPKRSKFFRYNAATGQVEECQRSIRRELPHYPMACEAMAVHPTQIGEAVENDRAGGVPTDYREDGSPIMRDARHYYRYRKMHGVHFKNGFTR